VRQGQTQVLGKHLDVFLHGCGGQRSQLISNPFRRCIIKAWLKE
jgi:hypothetical protein